MHRNGWHASKRTEKTFSAGTLCQLGFGRVRSLTTEIGLNFCCCCLSVLAVVVDGHSVNVPFSANLAQLVRSHCCGLLERAYPCICMRVFLHADQPPQSYGYHETQNTQKKKSPTKYYCYCYGRQSRRAESFMSTATMCLHFAAMVQTK